MGSIDVEYQFASFLEKSKQVKSRIDVILDLLYKHVIDNIMVRDARPKVDMSNMIELNQLFDLVNTYLSEFEKSFVPSVNGVEDCKTLNDEGTKQKCVENGIPLHGKEIKQTMAGKPKQVDVNEESKEANVLDETVENDSDRTSNQVTSNFDSQSNFSSSDYETTSLTDSVQNDMSPFTIEKKNTMEVTGEYKVSIKHVKNLNEFYVYVMNDLTKDFYKTWNNMVKFYKKHERDYYLKTYNCDIFIAVLYKSLWYRAKLVQKYPNNTLQVYLIDIGKSIETKCQDVRLLKSKFNFPIILQKVTLNLDFNPRQQALFNALVGDEKILYKAQCVDKVDDKFQVTLQEINSVVINDVIKGVPFRGNADTQELNEPLTLENASTREIDPLEDFDPMKEDYLSQVNDYKINPDNACQAVLGYIPNDDRRYCKFGKQCWKKRCPRLHEEQDPNGWTKGIEHALAKPYETVELPLHEYIQISILHVVDIGEFYAHVETTSTNEEEETLESLIEYMNQKDNVLDMKKLKIQPASAEILIASYKGYYYRGKVLSYNPENDTALIFFVDLGSSEHIHLRDLRQMESKYNYLPFQAFHFSVKHHLEFNLSPSSKHYDICLKLFHNLFLYQSFQCVIESNSPEPYDVLLFTKETDNMVEYFSKCCKRILGDEIEDDTTSSMSTGSLRSARYIYGDDVNFVPA
ncbi:hypothetical protein M8J77_025335 [Diaphorina citri]|nr:hypothetical protein M8J77_025335 [Diaphorina citri]